MTGIVDYGVGNLFSLRCSLAAIGEEAVVSSDEATLAAAERIILPGVGAFGDAMDKLEASGLIPCLKREAASGKPFLGVCLGMQLLFDRGHEFGLREGLGLIPGDIVPLADALKKKGLSLKVPQIGWNSLRLLRDDCALLSRTRQGDFVYYVHSFYADCPPEHIAADSDYGAAVPGVVFRGNVFGAQFHPEKSGAVGLDILRAFVGMGG